MIAEKIMGNKMNSEKVEKQDLQYRNEDRYATPKDLEILSLKLGQKISDIRAELKTDIYNLELNVEKKINSVVYKLGGLIVTCFGVLSWIITHAGK